MSETLTTFDQPTSLVSAGAYRSYLWIGHCLFNPKDYKRDITGFHQNKESVDLDYARFKKKCEQGHAAVLLPYLTGIVKNAKLELGIENPVGADKRRLLQVYLIGEVSVRGMEAAQHDGLIEDYPDLATVTSPFVDNRLVDMSLRLLQGGGIRESMTNYATVERLLPGYQKI